MLSVSDASTPTLIVMNGGSLVLWDYENGNLLGSYTFDEDNNFGGLLDAIAYPDRSSVIALVWVKRKNRSVVYLTRVYQT